MTCEGRTPHQSNHMNGKELGLRGCDVDLDPLPRSRTWPLRVVFLVSVPQSCDVDGRVLLRTEQFPADDLEGRDSDLPTREEGTEERSLCVTS